MAEVAILGLGAMGSRLAASLLGAGHAVTVWNRTPQRAAPLLALGARLAASPGDAAAEAAFVIAMLRDDEASRAVWCNPHDGALAAMRPGAIAIECSTLTPSWVTALAQQAEWRGIAFVDAPVVGSRPQADARQLIFLAGGEADVIERSRPVLLAAGSAVHHAGKAGDGMRLKLAVNALFATQVAALAELLSALVAAGLPAERVLDIFGQLPVLSAAGRGAAAMMAAQQHAPLFPVELVVKDLEYQLQAAGPNPVLTGHVCNLFRAAAEAGHGNRNITAIAEWIKGLR